ncbi:uncharacterized protein BO66DRAFT_158131 [Aspergillus aculeatinus CBS 121060]|uniref:Uncharacterized protein n=1 Tax=Aspergillus aculeatinus CBS 121060 TaxID=1448322 RepID=A0ACD1H0I0_9EURO|nr:hypothetical protein BO66DRAFT_158131 [Aspergillus aculeatinus CBS 121060]RAH67247.1 hypothetical protein BO66DRAFT_158131 [Aspergillus aculeatinus CBS 121060]
MSTTHWFGISHYGLISRTTLDTCLLALMQPRCCYHAVPQIESCPPAKGFHQTRRGPQPSHICPIALDLAMEKSLSYCCTCAFLQCTAYACRFAEDLDYFVFRIFLFCDHRNNTFLCLMFGILRFIPTSRNQEPQKKRQTRRKKATKQRREQRKMRRGTNREKSVVRPFFMLSTPGGKRKKPAPGRGLSNFCFLAAAKMYCNLLYVACKQ